MALYKYAYYAYDYDYDYKLHLCSGAGTNLKVGDLSGAKVGGTEPKRRKNFFRSCPSTFWL